MLQTILASAGFVTTCAVFVLLSRLFRSPQKPDFMRREDIAMGAALAMTFLFASSYLWLVLSLATLSIGVEADAVIAVLFALLAIFATGWALRRFGTTIRTGKTV
ncbi:MAG: hypothetical protein KDJ77_04985 [Rhodobiaceae bacterium]|nr:hypothetical protein [Rhodobiaceae bacterium]